MNLELTTKIIALVAAILALSSAIISSRNKKDAAKQMLKMAAPIKKKEGDFPWGILIIFLAPIFVLLWLTAFNLVSKLFLSSAK